jgi:hypothetical protein
MWYRIARDPDEFRAALGAAYSAARPAIVEIPFNER